MSTLCQLPLKALRHEPEGAVCGWYIWGGQDLPTNSEFFQSLCVEHLSEYVPELVPTWVFVLGGVFSLHRSTKMFGLTKRSSMQAPNPSIERTCPGKPGRAFHLKR